MIVNNDLLHDYEIKLLVPRNSISVGVQALANVPADKHFILTLEGVSRGEKMLDPRDLGWGFSKSLQRSFAYVPAMRIGAIVRIPGVLSSELSFDSVTIGVRAWHTKLAADEISTVFGRLWYSQLELPSVTAASGPVHSIVRTVPLRSSI
ncbi:hypothetical protein ACOM2C_05550 [Pseudarthrobacter sp. So.54]